MKKILLALLALPFLSVDAQELPSQPKPGKCYIKCITADEFTTETKTLVVSPSFKKLRVIPATFKTVTDRVLIKEATVKKVFVPAVFETVRVDVPGAGSFKNYRVVPAKFGSSSETFEVYPKTGKWEYTELDNCPSANKEDCVVACFVERPSRSTTIPVKTLAADAQVLESSEDLKGTSYTKRVIKTPPTFREIPVPAEYGVIKKRVVDVPAKIVEEVVPQQTKTVTITKLSKKGGITVWEEVDCNIASGANMLPINYELNSARITGSSARILDNNLVNLMRSKPGLRIEIMSHTDSRGDDSYNRALSQQRAQSVVNYLVRKGISRSRLIARGYGESRLVNRCGNGVNCSESQHSQNRRTEFRILR